jgi:hypothetical protein
MMQFWADPSLEGKAKHSIEKERTKGAVGLRFDQSLLA